ncbi:hypothetical protein ACET3Z_011173 [Daucus carota]
MISLLSISQAEHHPSLLTLFGRCNFDKIFQFGDSISDTGNFLVENPLDRSGRLPYGVSNSNTPTGRYCDGLLMIDYVASAAGLPLLNPYEDTNADFTYGINFAVVGATALSVETLARKNIFGARTNSTLDVQLSWMSRYLSSYCKSEADCREKLKNSLFFMGEIGGNDFNYAFFGGMTIEEAKNLVPEVVQTIMNATREIIKLGARNIVIPGNFPIGYELPTTTFRANSSFDLNHCLRDYNQFSVYYNLQLRVAIVKLQLENPSVAIVYGDLYFAFQRLFSPTIHPGFDPDSLLKACCGTGGDYNFGFTMFCGNAGVPVSKNQPKRLTE